jgi:uncharacterized protein with HEPN domain
MSKDEELYLGHMLDAAQKAMEKVQGISREEYNKDENLRLALIHLVQIIGEAGRRVSPGTQQEHPEIPWSNIIGMRHRIVHDYIDVDDKIVWDVVTSDLPQLVESLKKFVPE